MVYCWIDANVYRKSTDDATSTTKSAVFVAIYRFRAYYHQQYLEKNPDGYCPDHSCGIPYKSPQLEVGEKV
jgi:peptide methionine sulfoxide reductase MsrA